MCSNTLMCATERGINYDALWDETASFEDQVLVYQHLIDTGQAWSLEGHVGRTAMRLIEDGFCVLGPEPHVDFWGNRIPSRHEVEAGTKGSASFVEAQAALRGEA